MKTTLIIISMIPWLAFAGNQSGNMGRTVDSNDLAKLRTEIPDLNMKAIYLSHIKTGVDTIAFQKIDLATQKVQVVEKNYYDLDMATKNALQLSEHLGSAVEIK